MSLGMKLTKIHRACEYEQKTWMESYIRFNADLPNLATNDTKDRRLSSKDKIKQK